MDQDDLKVRVALSWQALERTTEAMREMQLNQKEIINEIRLLKEDNHSLKSDNKIMAHKIANQQKMATIIVTMFVTYAGASASLIKYTATKQIEAMENQNRTQDGFMLRLEDQIALLKNQENGRKTN